jgi:RecB family exonuclease
MDNIKLTGRFDRVDKYDGGVVIMDFKTSEIKAQKDADKRVKESKQLLLYSMAWQNIKGELPRKIALYFLESGIIGETEVKENAFEAVKEDIRTVASGIRKQDYRATPAYMACNYCAYSRICPSAALK